MKWKWSCETCYKDVEAVRLSSFRIVICLWSNFTE